MQTKRQPYKNETTTQQTTFLNENNERTMNTL